MANQRKNVRVSTSRTVEILLSDGSSVEAVIVNISSVGVCIHYAGAADIGSNLNIRFYLPEVGGASNKIEKQVTVVHVHFYHDIYRSNV